LKFCQFGIQINKKQKTNKQINKKKKKKKKRKRKRKEEKRTKGNDLNLIQVSPTLIFCAFSDDIGKIIPFFITYFPIGGRQCSSFPQLSIGYPWKDPQNASNCTENTLEMIWKS